VDGGRHAEHHQQADDGENAANRVGQGDAARERRRDGPAGGTGEMYLEMRPDDATNVASCEIYPSCRGRNADGVYCPE